MPPQTPPSLPNSLTNFFSNFYKQSDTPDAHDAYAACFTHEGVMVLGRERVQGRSGIVSLRRRMWMDVGVREHRVLGVFGVRGEGEGEGAEREVMLYGSVSYGFRDGGGDEKDWAARAVLVRAGGGDGDGDGDENGREDGRQGWRMRFYQVYLDTTAKK